jgi:hypothetical protein
MCTRHKTLPRLYLESNYLMSICTGRTPGADALLQAPVSIELAIPAVCRDPDIHAQDFKKSLAAADAALTQYLAQSENRLLDAMASLLARARVVQSSAAVLSRSAHSYLSEPTDDIIAAGFQQPTLTDAMRGAGVETLGTQLQFCLEWAARFSS